MCAPSTAQMIHSAFQETCKEIVYTVDVLMELAMRIIAGRTKFFKRGTYIMTSITNIQMLGLKNDGVSCLPITQKMKKWTVSMSFEVSLPPTNARLD